MQPKYVALALAYAAAAVASPVEVDQMANPGYVELFREPAKLSEGTLIWYGPENATGEKRDGLDARAGCTTTGTSPVCSSDHAARNAVCDSLIGELNSDGSNSVPESPRQICYEGASEKNSYCCVSWHTVVPGLTKSDLAGPAQTIASQCTSNGISGYIKSVLLNRTCSKLCVSNRGTHC